MGEDDEKPIFSDDLDSDLEVENWDEYGVDPDEQGNFLNPLHTIPTLGQSRTRVLLTL